MNSIKVDLIDAEEKAKDITIKNHARVLELLAIMLNLYTNGFSLIPNLNDKTSDTDWVWLFLITRSFLSIRCAVELMKKAYYAQAMALMRIVTEAYFLCGNCEKNKTIVDGLLRNKPNTQDSKTIFQYKKLAKDMDALDVYDKDYTFECKFSHTSSLSLGIMTTEINSRNHVLRPIPTYNEILFLMCCESAFRNGLLMADFLEKFLDNVSKEKGNVWRIKAGIGIQQIQEWLAELKERLVELKERHGS